MKKSSIIWLAAAGIMLLIGILLKCNSNKQDDAIISNAVSQHEVEELTTRNETLQLQLLGHRQTEDSLWLKVKQYDSKIVQLNTKYRQIALKYEIERNRVKELPDDSAVGLFLDASNCGELPILKYDTLYLIPICPIRSYNDLKVGYDMQADLIPVLQTKTIELSGKIGQLNGIISERGQQIKTLNEVVSNTELIVTEKDKQIQNASAMLKAQKRKTWLLIGIGAAALGVSLAL